MSKYLDSNGLLYFWQKIKEKFVAKETGKTLSTNDYTTADKTKLAGIDTGANNYVLPAATDNSLGGIKVGAGLQINANGVLAVTGGGEADSVEWDNVLHKVKASPSVDGVMAKEDKSKLDGIESGANNYILSAATSSTLGGVKVGTNLSIDNGVLSATDTIYSDATTFAHGLMSTNDKSKLDEFGSASIYALKSEISGVYKYKGSVATYSDLPSSGQETGDVYNVESNGQNYAWTSTEWDSLGEVFQITDISNLDIDTIVAS